MTRHSCIKNKHRLAGARNVLWWGVTVGPNWGRKKKVGAVLFCFHIFLPVIFFKNLHTESV